MRLAPAPKAVKVVDEVVVDEVAVDTAVVVDEVAVEDTVAAVDDATSKCHLYKWRQGKT